MRHECCKELTWDSCFFGIRVARFASERLNGDSAAAALDFCRERSVECLYLLLCDEAETNAAAETYGFEWVDTRLTLARSLAALEIPADTYPTRSAERSDVAALRDIARTSHRDSRFYSDPHFDRGRCDALYETWIEKAAKALPTARWWPTMKEQWLGTLLAKFPNRDADRSASLPWRSMRVAEGWAEA